MRPNCNTVKDFYLFGSNELKNNHITNYKKESEWILRYILNKDSSWFICNSNYLLDISQAAKFIDCINKRKDHIPLQLILGFSTFYGRDFKIFPDVFIPRPETEQIIDMLMGCNYNHALDICSGSGVLAISLYLESIVSSVEAIDVSSICLENISENINYYSCSDAVYTYMLDILTQIPDKKYDLIVCNPPYIEFNDIKNLSHDVKHYDPLNALTDYKDGLSFYRRINSIIKDILVDNGVLLLEFGGDEQVNDVELIFNQYQTSVFNDFNNHPRIMKIIL